LTPYLVLLGFLRWGPRLHNREEGQCPVRGWESENGDVRKDIELGGSWFQFACRQIARNGNWLPGVGEGRKGIELTAVTKIAGGGERKKMCSSEGTHLRNLVQNRSLTWGQSIQHLNCLYWGRGNSLTLTLFGFSNSIKEERVGN